VKVGVNLLWLRPGVVGGSEQYLTRLLVGLAELAPADLDVTVFALPGFAPAHPEVPFPVVAAPIGGGRRPLRVAAEATWLAAQARRRGLDLVHHGGGTLPAVLTAPAVLTVHDLQYLTYPASFSTVKLAYLRRTVPRSVRRAAAVTTPSAYVRSTVVERLGADPARVHVVPHGIPEAEVAAPPTAEAELRARYGLAGPFFLYPAITYPHKNHVVLVRALARLGGDAQLVLLGGRGPAEDTVAEEVARLGLQPRVVRPGRVSDADRNGFYRAAMATLVPSRYEGFGAPALEAMRLGCPLVAADVTALPEVVGEAGRLVDPDDVDGWARAMAELLDDPAERARLRAAGEARAAELTARRSAEALLAAYRAVPVAP